MDNRYIEERMASERDTLALSVICLYQQKRAGSRNDGQAFRQYLASPMLVRKMVWGRNEDIFGIRVGEHRNGARDL